MSETRRVPLLDAVRRAWLCVQGNIYVRGKATGETGYENCFVLLGKKKAASCYCRSHNYYNHRIIAIISAKAVFFLPKCVQLGCLGRQCQHTQETNDKD